MNARLFPTMLLAAFVAAGAPASADEDRHEHRHGNRTTIAVFGDWPYSKTLFDNAQVLIDSVNSDAEIGLVMHLGDIHAGGAPCTSAGILPPISTADPGWNQSVYALFQKFEKPFVYTPGDNEWTDCHRKKTLESGDPLKELSSLRSLFFARPGRTLGLNDREVYSQAKHFDPSFPSDAQFVENVMWKDATTVFATVNMPGSNNDGLPWSSFENGVAHATEIAERTAAAIRWIQAAFTLAAREHAAAVVIGLQADMWDKFAAAPGGDGLDRYTPFVQELASQSRRFGRPVLLLNGDSHIFGADQPLADPDSATGKIHNTPPVPNLTRVTVQGATSKPAEWLKLSIDTRKPQVFSWTNVAYCADPATSCN